MRERIILVLVIGILMPGCGLFQRQEAARDLSPLLGALSSPIPQKRDSARSALDQQLFLTTDLPDLFAALDKTYPDDSLPENSTRQKLLAVLRDVHNPETTVFLEGLYPRIQSNSGQAATALSVLVLRNSEPAGRIFLDALENGPLLSEARFEQATADYLDHPEYLVHVFPRFLGFRKVPAYRNRVYELTALALEKEAFGPQLLKDSLSAILNFYEQDLAACRATRKPEIECNDCAEILKIMAFYPENRRSWTLMDEILSDDTAPDGLRLIALEASLKGDLPISSSTLSSMSLDLRTRNRTYALLKSRGLDERFEADKNLQLAIAEGDLASWLRSPQQKGRLPNTIEFLTRHREPAIQGNLYLFRFNYGSEWMIGISGPQPADTTQAVAVGTLTGSQFEAEEEKSLEQHVQALIGDM